MSSISILFLGGAKRVSMARRFKESAASLGIDCRIFSYELSTKEPIACEAEVIVGRRWKDPEVDADLRRIIAENDIRIVVPFVDGAVAVAARLAEVAFVPSGSPEQAEAMFDKVAAARLFEKAGVAVPQTFRRSFDCQRYIAKPRHGSASKGIVVCESAAQVGELAATDDYLIQEYIADREEYTVDCYASVVSGQLLVACPRRRIEVIGGEVFRTVTVRDEAIESLAAAAVTRLGLRGAVTVQILRDRADGRLMIMEINPRLGGGAVCSVAAGADIPGLILREAYGFPLEAPQWRAGVEIARYPAEVVFYN